MTRITGCLFLAAFCLAGVSAINWRKIIGGSGNEWKNLYLKYDLFTDGYFPIDFDLDTLLQGDWAYMATDKELMVDFYAYQNDPAVSIGFDQYGSIAAVRVAYAIADLANKAKEKGLDFPVDYSKNPMYTNATIWDEDVMYTQVLFVSPEQLKAGGRIETGGVLGENVYVKINGVYTAMPRSESDAPSLGFTKQGCFVGMGQHYFLGVTEDADCATMPGVFLLYDGGELIGMGLIPFGAFKSKSRDWFENPPAAVVKMIVPNRPACLTEWTTNYGSIGLHFLFKQHPRMTFCF